MSYRIDKKVSINENLSVVIQFPFKVMIQENTVWLRNCSFSVYKYSVERRKLMFHLQFAKVPEQSFQLTCVENDIITDREKIMALYNKNKKLWKQLLDAIWETFLRFILLKKTHFGAAWPPHTSASDCCHANTLPSHASLSSFFLVLTLAKAVGNCPNWTDQSILPPQLQWLLQRMDRKSLPVQSESNQGLKGKKKKGIGRLWHHVFKWKWIWTLCSPVCWHHGESSLSMGENEVWQRHTERSSSWVPIF